MHWMEALKPRISHGLPVLFSRVKRPKILVKKLLCLPTFDEIASDKRKYAESFYIQYQNTDPFSGKRMIETVREHVCT